MAHTEHSPGQFSRRHFLRNASAAAGVAAAGVTMPSEAMPNTDKGKALLSRPPNVLMICADQFRADFVGANHKNPSASTPHIDALAARGVNFKHCFTNQPLCSPSRASFITSRYATETGVWKLGLELDHSLPTIATEFKRKGYSTNFIGKWHISREAKANEATLGWVAPGPQRGGFDDIWEGANVLELVSHPYEGNYWDTDGKNIGYKDEYRVDFITSRAVSLIEQEHDKPWLLFLSQLEPHQQNDVDDFIPPKRYEDKYVDPYVPQDLRNLPGNWRSRIGGYYGCVQAIDDCVGSLIAALEKTGQLENTIVLFFSDHGCTFRTRLGEYKRSPHDSATHVPFILAGPGFDRSQVITEIVTLLDLTPTLLSAAGFDPGEGMRGRSLQELVTNIGARRQWDSCAYFQISDSMCARGIRTNDWCYCAYDPSMGGGQAAYSRQYQDFALYSVSGDSAQQVNLVGRPEYKQFADELRDELKKRILAAGELEASIQPVRFYA